MVYYRDHLGMRRNEKITAEVPNSQLGWSTLWMVDVYVSLAADYTYESTARHAVFWATGSEPS